MGSKKSNSKKPETFKQMLSKMKIWQLVVFLVLVVTGSVLFVGAASGWFDVKKVVIDDEYKCAGEECEFEDLMASGYEDLIVEKKSFVVLVDQGGCKTADRLKEFMKSYMKEKGFKVYRMMFSEVKESSLHEFVKYYPSVAMIADGRVITYLRADSDEDAEIYNDDEEFKRWMDQFVSCGKV